MPGPFDALDAMVSAAVEEAFGSGAIIQPRAGLNQYGGPVADPARPPGIVTGVFSSASATAGVEGSASGEGRKGGTKIGGLTPVFWLSPAAVASLGYAVRAGDGLVLTGPPARTFRISRADPTDTGDLELVLTEE